jgi:fluoride exporter
MTNILYVALGGALGSLLRYGLSAGLLPRTAISVDFPWATFIANISGCFLIGLFAGFAQKNLYLNPPMQLLLMTGFCGGFTTFSTFSLETIQLLRLGAWPIALAYVCASNALGFGAILLGLTMTRS